MNQELDRVLKRLIGGGMVRVYHKMWPESHGHGTVVMSDEGRLLLGGYGRVMVVPNTHEICRDILVNCFLRIETIPGRVLWQRDDAEELIVVARLREAGI